MFFLEIMVKLRYDPSPYDLKNHLAEILKEIWNYNTHSDKHECLNCLIYEEWCIDFARTKWQPDYVDFNFAIEKIRQRDRTFIDFDQISLILDPDKTCCMLKEKNNLAVFLSYKKWDRLILLFFSKFEPCEFND